MTSLLGGRLPLLDPKKLGEAAQQLYDRLADRWSATETPPFKNRTDEGELIGPFNALLYAPEIGAAFLDLHQAEERTSPLSKRVREVVILSVGAVWRSEYELYAHRSLARSADFSPESVAALTTASTHEALSDDERIAQLFTIELVSTRHVNSATYQAAERVFGRNGLVALTFLAGIYGVTCTVLNAYEVPAPAE